MVFFDSEWQEGAVSAPSLALQQGATDLLFLREVCVGCVLDLVSAFTFIQNMYKRFILFMCWLAFTQNESMNSVVKNSQPNAAYGRWWPHST